MLWNLDLKGVVVLACNVAGIGVIPAALNLVGVLVSIVTIIGADDPSIEAKNVLKDWARWRAMPCLTENPFVTPLRLSWIF